MKNFVKLSIFLFGVVMSSCISCSSSDGPVDDKENPVTPPIPPVSEKMCSTDMVLIYGGGHHRDPYTWDSDRLASYVTYIDKAGEEHWLFDAFLFLELKDTGVSGNNKTFTFETQEKLDAANQKDWKQLVDYYFNATTGLGALNRAVGRAKTRLGEPKAKHQVVIAIPEPIVHKTPSDEKSTTVYWGNLNGHIMDFSINKDRVDACKWYIDYVCQKWKELKYPNLEFAGFYWLAETAGNTRDIIALVGDYVRQLNYPFKWIPYHGAEGHNRWETYGFTEAYYQPNYFFQKEQTYAVLEESCRTAIREDLDMEFEFDYRVLASNPEHDIYYPRMKDYMKAFKNHKIWDEKRLAYYEGGGNLLSLKNSQHVKDQELYHEFCQFVITRPIRSK